MSESTGTGSTDAAQPPEIQVQNPGHYAGLGRGLGRWLRGVVAALAPEAASLTLRLTTDREMRRLNREYRSLDRVTDVLSFPGEPGPEGWHLGDVVVAVPTVRRQADEAGHSAARELRVLALHGVLHCLGYDHETDDGAMERLERRSRRRFIPTAEPVR